MDLNGLSLYVPRSKFVLRAVSPELRNYEAVEHNVNYELRKYYINVSDCSTAVVDRCVVPE